MKFFNLKKLTNPVTPLLRRAPTAGRGRGAGGEAALLALLLLAACKVPAPVALRSQLQIPTQFSATADTTTPVLNPKAFFPDPHLAALLDEAIRQNPDLLMATQRIEVARSQYLTRRSERLPAVDALGSAAVTRYGQYTLEGVGNFDTNLSGNIAEKQKPPYPYVPDYFLGLRSRWELDLWGRLKNAQKAAQLRLLATEAGRRAIVTALVSEVAARYYELLALDAEIGVLDQNIALQDSALAISVVQKEAGRITQLGVEQFRAQLLRTRAARIRTTQEVRRAENELAYLLGRFPQPIARSRDFLNLSPPTAALQGLPIAVISRRPDIVEAELELQAASYDIAAARAALLPSLNLSPFVGLQAFRAGLLFDPASLTLGIAGGLAAPVFNRTALKAGVSRSEAEGQIALQQYNKAFIGAFRELETAQSDLQKLHEIYQITRDEAAVLESAVEMADELYKVGYANYLEVITAQRAALEAELNAIQTKRQLQGAFIQFYRALGGGWEG